MAWVACLPTSMIVTALLNYPQMCQLSQIPGKEDSCWIVWDLLWSRRTWKNPLWGYAGCTEVSWPSSLYFLYSVLVNWSSNFWEWPSWKGWLVRFFWYVIVCQSVFISQGCKLPSGPPLHLLSLCWQKPHWAHSHQQNQVKWLVWLHLGISRSCTAKFSLHEQRWSPLSCPSKLYPVSVAALFGWSPLPCQRAGGCWCSLERVTAIGIKCILGPSCFQRKNSMVASWNLLQTLPSFPSASLFSPHLQVEQKQLGSAGSASVPVELIFMLVNNTEISHILETSPSPQRPLSVWFTAGGDSVVSLLYCCCCCCCCFTWFGMWAFWDGVGCVGSCGWLNRLFFFFLSLFGSCLSVCFGRVINELLTYVLGIVLRRFACW